MTDIATFKRDQARLLERGTCAECLLPIRRNEVPKHARRHQVGTDHLFVRLQEQAG